MPPPLHPSLPRRERCRRNSNITFAFLNFVHPHVALRAFCGLSGRRWRGAPKTKPCRNAQFWAVWRGRPGAAMGSCGFDRQPAPRTERSGTSCARQTEPLAVQDPRHSERSPLLSMRRGARRHRDTCRFLHVPRRTHATTTCSRHAQDRRPSGASRTSDMAQRDGPRGGKGQLRGRALESWTEPRPCVVDTRAPRREREGESARGLGRVAGAQTSSRRGSRPPAPMWHISQVLRPHGKRTTPPLALTAPLICALPREGGRSVGCGRLRSPKLGLVAHRPSGSPVPMWSAGGHAAAIEEVYRGAGARLAIGGAGSCL